MYIEIFNIEKLESSKLFSNHVIDIPMNDEKDFEDNHKMEEEESKDSQSLPKIKPVNFV